MTRTTDPRALCLRSIEIMATGVEADFHAVVHPEAVNREAKDEPPACRVPGPAGFHATALWLRAAYSDLHWEVHDTVVDGDLVVVHATMSGRHTGPFVTYTAEGGVEQAFPPTGLTFATTQTHWFRVTDGLVREHWANRDDLGTAKQLAWVPPTPAYLFRMARATRAARRAERTNAR
ncbi:ester cyclase [Nocardia sp. NPDC057353]|uniref:ester cyclase n=1 Tax=Nocardia sp. NPDC057353 TaxID=3346104 RepID=UPI003637B923